MIVSFFFLLSYVLKAFKARIFQKTFTSNYFIKSDAIQLLESLQFESAAIFDDEVGLRFMPPVFNQRYCAVYEVLSKLQLVFDIKKVVDIGCSEISFFTHIKRLESVEEYIGVDIDLPKLERFRCRVTPLNTDYLRKRCTPLKVRLLNGSAIQPDERLKNANAIVAIELIEHMYPPELDDLPYNIFGVIQPEVAVFTTPNADFNVLFKNYNPNEFRHYDHKFEWSRIQFAEWGSNITLRYPAYEVWFNGIGKGPDGTEEFGCCSQVAVFVRSKEKTEASDFGVFFKSVHEVDYPTQTKEEKLNEILEYEVYQFVDHFSENEKYLVENKISIPLDDILKNITVSCTEEKLKEFLEKSEKVVKYINNKFSLVLPSYADDNTSLSSYDNNETFTYYKEEEENWSLEQNDIANKDISSDEHWNLWNVEEMKPNGNSLEESTNDHNFDTTNDSEDIHCSEIRSKENDLKNIEVSTMLVDVSKKNISGSFTPINEEESECNTSAAILGEIELYDRTVESFSQHSISSHGAIPKADNTPQNSFKSVTVFKRDTTLIDDDISREDLELSAKDLSSLFNNSYPENDLSQYVMKSPCSSLTGINPEADISKFDSVPQLNFPPDNKMHNKEKKEQASEAIKNLIEVHILPTVNGNRENSQHEEVATPNSNYDASGECKEISTHVNMSDRVKEVGYDQASSGAVPRSHSLENVSTNNCKKKNFRYSLNIDNKEIDCDTEIVDMELDVCCNGSSIPSLTETCGSHSKAADSGYPNSTQDMDLDLTPEQVDEIITETESSLEDEESSADERVEQVLGNPPLVFADNVENGDVANNNRDGEGNNMEGGQVLVEELVFEDLVLVGEEVEAGGEHESDDEGLFLSALDVSSRTLVPEELSSAENTVYLFDLPSTSSIGSIQVEENGIRIHSANEFPAWLLNMIVQDEDHGSGDAGPDRNEDSSEVVIDREEQADIYPGDARAGGEPTMPEN